MSLIIDPTTAAPAAEPPTPGRPPSRTGIWIRVGLALALIAASAGLRHWQQGRFNEVLRSGRASPFPLAQIPTELGSWRGIDDELDPKIANATGAVDAVFRTYTNINTGVRVSLILLYGPATEVFIHAPETCYPTSGYATLSGPESRPIRPAGGDEAAAPVPFYAHTFTRGEGGGRDTQRVFCSWRYEGLWMPVQAVYKRSERMPGVYKLHLARQAVPGELFEARDPCEDLAALLLPEIQGRLERHAAGL